MGTEGRFTFTFAASKMLTGESGITSSRCARRAWSAGSRP